jgi:hypothetical protein
MAAEPGATEYVTTTLRRRRKILTNNIENNNPVSRGMKEYDSFEMEPDGRTLFDEVSYQENATVAHYTGGAPIATAYNPTMTAFEVDWKQFAGSVQINGREQRINAGSLGTIKLLANRVKNLEFSLENFFNADLISDGTGDNGQQIGGLKYWVSSTPTSGTVGGIDRSTTGGTFARNFKFNTVSDTTGGAPGGVATTAATIKPYLNWCINSTTRSSDSVNLLLMGQSHFEFLQNAMQAIQRITDATQKAKAGFRMIDYEGIPTAMCGGINFGGETQLATDRTYGLNLRHTRMRIHKDAYMEPLPEVQSINQDAKVQIVVFMGNMTSKFPAGNFVMFDS